MTLEDVAKVKDIISQELGQYDFVNMTILNSRIQKVESALNHISDMVMNELNVKFEKLEEKNSLEYLTVADVFNKGETKAVVNNYLSQVVDAVKGIREDMDKIIIEKTANDDIDLAIQSSITFNNDKLRDEFMAKESIIANFENLKLYIDQEIESLE